MKLYCELAWLGGETAEPGVLLELAGDRIAAVSRPAAAPADAERLAGLTLPGLVSAHSHAFQRALRGRGQAGAGSFWSWRELMYRLAEGLDPDKLLALARATFAELALAGVTLVGEFHYLHHAPGGRPYADSNETGRALIRAAAQAGVRLTLIDACYLRGGVDKPLEGAQLRFGDGSAEAWAQRTEGLRDGERVKHAAAVHSVRATDPQAIRVVAEIARRRAWPLHAHVSEQPAENEACLAAYEMTPVALLAETGALGGNFCAVHATHTTAADQALLGRARAAVCLCPTTERDLGDGIGPAAGLRDAGTRLCLGSDSNAVVDLFEEARAVELDERLAGGRRGVHAPAELLRAATTAGASALGWPEAGRFAPGALADLAVVGLDSVRLAGGDEALAATVFAAGAADVRDVMVAGRWIVRGGRHVALEVAEELKKAIARAWR